MILIVFASLPKYEKSTKLKTTVQRIYKSWLIRVELDKVELLLFIMGNTATTKKGDSTESGKWRRKKLKKMFWWLGENKYGIHTSD